MGITRNTSVLILSVFGFGCALQCTPKKSGPENKSKANQIDFVTGRTADAARKEPNCKEDEADRIFSLLAYAVVLKDWQENGVNPIRGHNIGGVLVETFGKEELKRDENFSNADELDICKKTTIKSYKIRHWARNSNNITCNGTQHGEVRMMTQYLGQIDRKDPAIDDRKTLSGFTVYTTLEPCVMCSGMMMQQNVDRTVYGQTDFDFGKAIERVAYDFSGTADSKNRKGFKAFPRVTESEPSKLPLRFQIDNKFLESNPEEGDSREKTGMTSWLRTPDAKALYQEAEKLLVTDFKVKFPENQKVLEDARAFLLSVPKLDPMLDEKNPNNDLATKKCGS